MTITDAWLLVLDYYHDALPAELQWRPGMKCGVEDTWGLHSAPPATRCYTCGGSKEWVEFEGEWIPWRTKPHDIAAPALTDAAAMAVAKLGLKEWGWVAWCDSVWHYYDLDNPDTLPHAIILAAAELAQRERAK